MRILLTGTSGQLGGDLLRLLGETHEVIAPGRDRFDLSNPASIMPAVETIGPDLIVNPAAYTAVDKAETERELAYAVNAEGPRALGLAAASLNIPIIHFSTDYVFDGSGTHPWRETDPTGPLGVYGASKLAGEHALLETGAASLIFRTSWVYNSTGKNFLLTIMRLAQQKEELRIVDDQHGAPTWSRDLARMVLHVLDILRRRASEEASAIAEEFRKVQGIYHAAGSGETTWYGFAAAFLARAANLRPDIRFAKLIPISTSEYPTPAQRPSNSRLDCTRLRDTFGFSFPDWQDSAAQVVSELWHATI